MRHRQSSCAQADLAPSSPTLSRCPEGILSALCVEQSHGWHLGGPSTWNEPSNWKEEVLS
jgi:hypothetical protein